MSLSQKPTQDVSPQHLSLAEQRQLRLAKQRSKYHHYAASKTNPVCSKKSQRCKQVNRLSVFQSQDDQTFNQAEKILKHYDKSSVLSAPPDCNFHISTRIQHRTTGRNWNRVEPPTLSAPGGGLFQELPVEQPSTSRNNTDQNHPNLQKLRQLQLAQKRLNYKNIKHSRKSNATQIITIASQHPTCILSFQSLPSSMVIDETAYNEHQDLVYRLIEDRHRSEYMATINQHCDTPCAICTKLCYPSQIRSIKTPDKPYLPAELKNNETISVCTRCKTHLDSKNLLAPSKAYWNSLDPGQIPPELSQLTQAETRLLARMIPFVKIIKLTGRFGQYGFKGQAILFAQDVFEVTESLPTMLPRSPSNSGLVVITECLENLNITKEYTICRDRLYKALPWLLVENHLYSDVVIDNTVDLSEEPLVRIMNVHEPREADPQAECSHYKEINDVASILRASWNHSDPNIFDVANASKQSCTMAIANIIKANTVPPDQWSTCELDSNLLAGEELFTTLKNTYEAMTTITIDSKVNTEYLAVLRNNFKLLGVTVRLQFDDEPNAVGMLQNARNKLPPNITLHCALENMFLNHRAGILSVSCHSVSVLKYNGIFYLADSQPCGPKGVRARVDRGKACIIACETIFELERVCRRAFTAKNSAYSLHYVDIHSNADCIRDGTGNVVDRNSRVCSSNDDNQLRILTSNRPGHTPMESSYMNTIDVWRIVRATSHQGNSEIFTSGYAGVQCCAMALAFISKGIIAPPERWTPQILDEIMSAGDHLYYEIQSKTPANELGPNGFLQVRNLRIIKESFIMYDQEFSIDYVDDTDLFGNLCDELNDGIVGLPLNESLQRFFSHKRTGIIIAGSYAYGLMKFDNVFYMTDSHSCDRMGTTAPNGVACVLSCESLTDLYRLCRVKLGRQNTVYNLHFIDIVTEYDPVLDNHPLQDNNNLEVQNLPDNYTIPIDNVLETLEPFTSQVPTCIRNIPNANVQNLPTQDIENYDSQASLHYIPPATQNSSNGRIPDENQCTVGSSIDRLFQSQNSFDHRTHHNAPTLAFQTGIMLPNDPRQPDVEDELEISANNKITRKTRDNIVNIDHELRAEEYAWYTLFPYGINGLNEPSRQIKISPLDYFQFRLLGTDKRFQRNDYLFYALSTYEYLKVKSTIAACGKKIRGPDGVVEDLHLYMQNLRGSAAYWGRSLYELLAMIRIIGAPHYFGTFSCNDLHWPDMKKALLIADGRPDVDPSSIDIMETQKLVETYPVVVARHFIVHVHALMKRMKHDSTIFQGKIEDHWWRIEFQSRGSPHLHMVLWMKDYPSFETPEGIAKLDRVITCRLPDEKDPDFETVSKCQTHRHTDSCRKKDGTCRFFFPRSVCNETHVIAQSSDEFVRGGNRVVALKRRLQERWINNYSPALLRTWQGNMDLQACGSTKAIAFYICKYVAKSEPTKLNAAVANVIKIIMQEETDISRKLFKACMKILHERQVSASECAFRLCHLPLRHSSRKCVFLNTRKPGERYRVLSFNDHGEHIGYSSNIFERYEKRPPSNARYDFENMSLLEFAMNFEPVYKRQNDPEENLDVNFDDDNENIIIRSKRIRLSDGKLMSIRSRPAIVRVPYFTLSGNAENYYYSMLVQYLPYRNETELLDGFQNAREAFLARENRLQQINSHMELYRQRDQQLENAFNQLHAFELIVNFPDQDKTPEPAIVDPGMDNTTFESELQSLNMGQREFVQLVTNSVRNQIHGSDERVRIFLTGNAGTGKTKVLRVLEEQLNRCYGHRSVQKCALTGAAAVLTRGSTIHSLLKIPVQRDGKIVRMPPLTGVFLRRLRMEWRDIKFLFIDEISMVPYEMLVMIDSRLKQIKDSENFFGGLNVILFGDLMQLKPIGGNQVFNQPSTMIPATHLWRLFRLVELTQNMRQQGNDVFVDILNSLRVGTMRDHHFTELMKRVNVDTSGVFSIENAIRIYPTNAQVTAHNNKVLELYRSRGTSMYKITAQDTLIDAFRDTAGTNLENMTPTDINKTGGLPKELEIFVGAKVMLRSNIDVSKGLVNGSIGIITEIKWPCYRRNQIETRDIPSVYVKFGDREPELIVARSLQFPAKNSYGTIERRMLPMILCWACTVHKLQGSTVDYAVVYLGPKLFAEGQAYVALSRVKLLENLMIEELDCAQLTGLKPCNIEAMGEIERLRKIVIN